MEHCSFWVPYFLSYKLNIIIEHPIVGLFCYYKVTGIPERVISIKYLLLYQWVYDVPIS